MTNSMADCCRLCKTMRKLCRSFPIALPCTKQRDGSPPACSVITKQKKISKSFTRAIPLMRKFPTTSESLLRGWEMLATRERLSKPHIGHRNFALRDLLNWQNSQPEKVT